MKHVINLLQELSGYLAGIQNTIEKMVDELGGNVPEGQLSFDEVLKEPEKKEKPKITLEQVRAILAEKSRAGKTSDVKELITRYGATKLSEVKEEDYEAILEEVSKWEDDENA